MSQEVLHLPQVPPITLDNLSNVTAPSPATNDVLQYNGTAWVNGAPTGGGGATDLDDLTDVVVTSPATGDVLVFNGTSWVNQPAPSGVTTNHKRATITFTLGDGTNAIVAATEPEQWVELNFDGTIEGWSLLADIGGNLVVDVWKDTYANYPPVVGDSVCASAKPTLSGAVTAQSSTLTGWTTSITRGDVLKIHVDSAATLKRAVLSLRVVKT